MTNSPTINYDLHTHSYFSDGAYSPKELLSAAVDCNITHLALTDHDTVGGLEEAQQAARELDINFIPGIELSCVWKHQLLHLVGLNIDASNSSLLAGVAQNQERRWQRAEAIHRDLAKHDIEVRENVELSLQKGSVPTRPHFAAALVKQGHAKDKKQAFKRYLVKGKPGYVAMQWPELSEAANWINEAGGVAVLAHPMRYKFTRSRLIMLIEEMQEYKVNAIEVATPITDKQQMQMLAQLSLEHQLWASRGSDFHSVEQVWARLGGAPELPEDVRPVWQLFKDKESLC